ncbi:helix-turn-helix domain-containing protein [Jiangella alkaliphila]|uniref:Homeodomain-like domain-containing protein n=1 Tax=Jiangella alkaliphila TaxID=419479 RepID=A0A1H2J0T7_9ACTN|nr:hypothetical protein [Jiangella alkaliphila]SDU49990.1 hypothetical protein SAMN04488563_2189 [Jiangella alkaliphila]
MVERLIDDTELVARVHDMRADGKSYVQIKAELKVGASTISRILGVYGKGRARPRVTDALRGQARTLRADGRSVPEIAAELGMAKSTVWLITKDIPWTAEPRSSGSRSEVAFAYWRKKKAATEAEREQITSGIMESFGELTDRELLIAGAVAYWAEGTKSKPWNPRERLTFTNSDPDMIRLYLRWLSLLGVDQARLKYRVNIHESADVPAAETFWADVAGVAVERFDRATLKRHNPTTVRKNTGETYRGCLVVTVAKSAPEYRMMDGLWSAVAGVVRSRR